MPAHTTTRATNVSFTGPHSGFNQDGDEVPEWAVCLADDYGDAIGTIYHIRNYSRARNLAHKMSKDRRLPLESDAARD